MLNSNQKLWTIVLFSSLALNVFMLGVLSVHWFGARGLRNGPMGRHAHEMAEGMPGSAMRGPGGPELVRELVRVMGGPRDPRVHQLWQMRRADQAQIRQRLRDAKLEVQRAIAAEPFDPQRLEGALTQLQDVTQDAQRRAQKGALELAQKLTPEERAQLRP